MKKLLCIILLASTLPAFAVPKCIRYTTTELNAMTADELKAAIAQNKENMWGYSSFSSAERAENQNCLIQNQRISSALEMKTPKKQASTQK
ncbi:MAG: hypothetical protein C4516_05825 [Oxalobacter sp.]|nr:MAG: hypothetical protein C4516_05825 [Oxalobacter sp.]